MKNTRTGQLAGCLVAHTGEWLDGPRLAAINGTHWPARVGLCRTPPFNLVIDTWRVRGADGTGAVEYCCRGQHASYAQRVLASALANALVAAMQRADLLTTSPDAFAEAVVAAARSGDLVIPSPDAPGRVTVTTRSGQ